MGESAVRKQILALWFIILILSLALSSINLYTTPAAAQTPETIYISDIHLPDPLMIESPTDFTLSSLIWEPLTWYENGTLYPLIAQSWTATETTWIFTLRRGIYWNSGVALTATDVANTYNFLLTMPIEKRRGSAIWLLLSNIRSVKVVDKYTVEFELFRKDDHFPEKVTSNIFILPPHLLTYQRPTVKLWGSGMYYVASHTEDSIELAKNPYYHGKVPYPHYLTFTDNATSSDMGLLYPTLSGKQQYNIAIRLSFNTIRPPLDSWTYRYLLISSIDYDKLATWGEPGTPCLIRTPLCHSSFQIDRKVFNAADFIDSYEIDIKKIGTLNIYTTTFLKGVAGIVKTSWQKLGISVKIHLRDIDSLIYTPPQDADAIILPIAGGKDPYTLASPDFPFAKWRHPMFFIKLSEGITTGDESKLSSAVEILDYTYPAITLLFPKIQEKGAYAPFTIHTAGLGVPMLTSPADDPTIHYIEEPETETPTKGTSTTAVPNKWVVYTKITIFTLLGMALLLALYLMFGTIKNAIGKVKTGLSAIKEKLRRRKIPVEDVDSTVEELVIVDMETKESILKKLIGKVRTLAGKSMERLSYLLSKVKEKLLSILLRRKPKQQDTADTENKAQDSTAQATTETPATSEIQDNTTSESEEKNKENIAETPESPNTLDAITDETSTNASPGGEILQEQTSETNDKEPSDTSPPGDEQ